MEFFHFTFPQTVHEQNHHINTLELACLTVAVKLWGPYLMGQKVKVRCDNEATVSVVNTGKCVDPLHVGMVEGPGLYHSLLAVLCDVCTHRWH